MSSAPRCCVIRTKTGEWRPSQCQKPGSFLYEGKPYCHPHYPPNVAERQSATQARVRREMDRSEYRSALLRWQAECVAFVETVAENGYPAIVISERARALAASKPKPPEDNPPT